MFQKILIANRGEIACRVIRTARRMGIKTVAVYSEADRDALHVELADEAYFIGPAPAAQSYLRDRQDHRACKQTGAEAVHPGYGFLSENGASPGARREGHRLHRPAARRSPAMGDKIASKKLAPEGRVRIVPGYTGTDRRGRSGRDRAEDRLPGDDQGAAPAAAARACASSSDDAGLREGFRWRATRRGGVRRRPRLHREVHRRAAPHRDPGARRRARQRASTSASASARSSAATRR